MRNLLQSQKKEEAFWRESINLNSPLSWDNMNVTATEG